MTMSMLLIPVHGERLSRFRLVLDGQTDRQVFESTSHGIYLSGSGMLTRKPSLGYIRAYLVSIQSPLSVDEGSEDTPPSRMRSSILKERLRARTTISWSGMTLVPGSVGIIPFARRWLLDLVNFSTLSYSLGQLLGLRTAHSA